MAAPSWEEKYNEIQKEFDAYKQKVESNVPNIETSETSRSQHFWDDIINKIVHDPDSIKGMIKNKELSLNETNFYGQTVLHLAAKWGQYQLTQFCINAGSDLNNQSYSGKTAIDLAKSQGYFNVEQLLLFAQLNANVGNEIKHTAELMHKQNGVNQNILNELVAIGEQSKALFEKLLMELMINIINKRLSFDDTLLNLCWQIVSRDGKNPLLSELWKAISSQCQSIIQNGSKRDWYWLKKILLPSSLWFQDISNIGDREEEQKYDEKEEVSNGGDKKVRYLYYELLKLVDTESQNQLNNLENNVNILANEYKEDWDKLVKWDIPNEYTKVRQDLIPNGIVSQYTYNQLSETSGAAFNSPKFYDHQQYLSQLILLAQIVDDDFQRSIQDMFNIDKITTEATISFHDKFEGTEFKTKDEKVGDGKMKYLRGPVKLIERARAKAQNDYADEDYPASACVLDMNRCCLIFNDISTLLRAIRLFVNKVNYYQSGHIIGIVRDKNGFKEYVKDGVQYADIKLNVLIKGKHNNIIGEVQFLLDVMKKFKDTAHNLYAIQRKREAIEQSVSKILPLLLNDRIRLFTAGINGNVNELCMFSTYFHKTLVSHNTVTQLDIGSLMVVSNKNKKDLLMVDPATNMSILHRITTKNRVKALAFLQSILGKDEFIEELFKSTKSGQRPIEYAVRYGSVATVKRTFEIPEVRERFKKDADLYRLLYHLWCFNVNEHLIDYILAILNVSNEKICEMLDFEYPDPPKNDPSSREDEKVYELVLSQLDITNEKIIQCINYKYAQTSPNADSWQFQRYFIFNKIIESDKGNHKLRLKRLISKVGNKIFIDNIFKYDDWNRNVLEIAVMKERSDCVELILSFDEIKQKYMGNDGFLWRLLYVMFNLCHDLKIKEFLFRNLNGLDVKFRELIGQRYTENDGEFGEDALEFDKYTMIGMVAGKGSSEELQYILTTVGNQAFSDGILCRDGSNMNAIQRSIEQNKLENSKLILNVECITEKLMQDKDELHGVIRTLNSNFEEVMAKHVVQQLKLTKDNLSELKAYKDLNLDQLLNIL